MIIFLMFTTIVTVFLAASIGIVLIRFVDNVTSQGHCLAESQEIDA